MSFQTPDRALRRLVADLAKASAEDVDDILEPLEDAQRERVRGLLREYLGLSEIAAPPPAVAETAPPTPALGVEGLSPWLAERVQRAADLEAPPHPDGERPDRRHGGETMTPAAMAALKSVAMAAAREADFHAKAEKRREPASGLRRIFARAGVIS